MTQLTRSCVIVLHTSLYLFLDAHWRSPSIIPKRLLNYKTACTIATSIIFHSQLDYCNYLFNNIYSSETRANNPERCRPRSHENSQTSPHNSCSQITLLTKSVSTHPIETSISYL